MVLRSGNPHILDIHPLPVTDKDIVLGEDVSYDPGIRDILLLYFVVHLTDILHSLDIIVSYIGHIQK
tara:strand:- start:506 stop:706 length:201 start_codon:yes stop_codon:yes gene_type:complete